MSKMSRDKGARGEREVAKLLSGWSGLKAQRKLGAAREGGSDIEFCNLGNHRDHGDYQLRFDCTGGWSIEVKRQETLHIKKWWNQACNQAVAESNKPLLVWRVSGTALWDCMFYLAGQEVVIPLSAWYDINFTLGKHSHKTSPDSN